MSIFTAIWIVLEIVLAACIALVPQTEVVWLVALAASPILLLAFWKKSTLKQSQRVYSVVHALALGTVLLLAADNFQHALEVFRFATSLEITAYAALIAALLLLEGWILGSTQKRFLSFVFGELFVVAYCCIPQNTVAMCGLGSFLVIFASTCFVATAISTNKRLERAAKVLDVKNVAPRMLVRTLGFTATAANVLVVLVLKLCPAESVAVARLWTNIGCAVLDFVLMFSYLRQPMDQVAQYKLELLENQREGVNLQRVDQTLRDKLCNTQNPPFIMFLQRFFRMFIQSKTVGAEKITEPTAVLVANHYEIFGPFVTELELRLPFRPWTESNMTEKALLTRQIRSGVNRVTRKWLIKPLREALPKAIAKPLLKVVDWARPIAVYRQDHEKIAQMMDESVQAMLEGDFVLVFPEKVPQGENYKLGEIDTFQTGFCEIAPRFFAETGRELTFYPLYIDKKGRQTVVGEKVTFNSQNELHDEKQRVADQLYQNMQAVREQCLSRRKK